MRLSIASPNPKNLLEMVALVQRLDTALLGNEDFQKKMKSLEVSFLNWSINGYDYNENYRKAGVHMITVFLCRAVKVLRPMAIKANTEIPTETVDYFPVVIRSGPDIEVRTRTGSSLEISSFFTRGAFQSEEEFTRDLIDFMISEDYAGKWLDDHGR